MATDTTAPAHLQGSRLISIGRGWASKACDWLFPRFCPVCAALSDRSGRLLCWDCFRDLPLHAADERVCDCCGLSPEGLVESAFVCSACRHERPAFERARAAAAFRGGTRVLLHAFKYQRATWLCEDLTDLLQGCLEVHFERRAIDVVVPVPLHPRKQRQRTYNQSALLARSLARRLKLEMRDDLVRRTRATPSQTRLSAVARRSNMLGAFETQRSGWVRGRTVLLVDDVMTTGATLTSLAASLRAAGAWRVWAVTVARG